MQFTNPKAYRSLPAGISLFTKNIQESEILLLLIKGQYKAMTSKFTQAETS